MTTSTVNRRMRPSYSVEEGRRAWRRVVAAEQARFSGTAGSPGIRDRVASEPYGP